MNTLVAHHFVDELHAVGVEHVAELQLVGIGGLRAPQRHDHVVEVVHAVGEGLGDTRQHGLAGCVGHLSLRRQGAEVARRHGHRTHEIDAIEGRALAGEVVRVAGRGKGSGRSLRPAIDDGLAAGTRLLYGAGSAYGVDGFTPLRLLGWAIPATLGVAIANGAGRTIVVTGDGSHQLTLNVIGVIGRYGIKPVIFVLNSGNYGIEDVVSERGHAYDDIAPVQYHLLPEAMGCKGWLSRWVSTIGELEDALAAISAGDAATYIEVMIPESASQPLPDWVIDTTYKICTPTA